MTSQWLAISVTHSLTQIENNVEVEELFEDDADNPEPEDATHDKLKDFNEERKETGTSQYQKKLKNACHVIFNIQALQKSGVYQYLEEDATHDKVEYFNDDFSDSLPARVLTKVMILTRFLCREAMLKLRINLKMYFRR